MGGLPGRVYAPRHDEGAPNHDLAGVPPRLPDVPLCLGRGACARGCAEGRFARIRVSYDDVGEGPTIVLISGFSQSGGDRWELGYADRLVVLGRRVLVVDPLGRGVSDRPHEPAAYQWPDVALDIVATMDAAGIAQAILWGFSRGAALAACIAAECPDRIVGLVLGAGGDLGDTPPTALTPASRPSLTATGQHSSPRPRARSTRTRLGGTTNG